MSSTNESGKLNIAYYIHSFITIFIMIGFGLVYCYTIILVLLSIAAACFNGSFCRERASAMNTASSPHMVRSLEPVVKTARSGAFVARQRTTTFGSCTSALTRNITREC